MRVAYVCSDPGIPVFGRKGCSIHVQEVVRALSRHGMQVELFTPRPEGEPPPGLEGLRVHALPALPRGDPGRREQAALALNPLLRTMLEHQGPFDWVYERYSLWSFAGMDYAGDRGVPGLLEVNAPLIDEQAVHRILIDRAAAERVAKHVFGAASVLLAVSEEVADYVNGFPAARGRIHVVPNGVDPRRFTPRPAASRPANPGIFTVGFVGTLKPWHGLATLIEAVARLHARSPDVRLVIVGDGPERPRLEADLATRRLQEAACWTGSVAAHDVPGLLRSMDAAVAPYEAQPRFYFSPLKVFEYMAAGLPVVASGIGQLRHIIRDGETGLLCPPGDALALSTALEWVRSTPDLRQHLGQQARAWVLREHTWDTVARRILHLAGMGQQARVRKSMVKMERACRFS